MLYVKNVSPAHHYNETSFESKCLDKLN